MLSSSCEGCGGSELSEILFSLGSVLYNCASYGTSGGEEQLAKAGCSSALNGLMLRMGFSTTVGEVQRI